MAPWPGRPAADRRLAAGIFFLVFALYLVTYNGAFKSNDERALFSGTDSFVKRGSFTIDQIYWDYTHVGMLTEAGEMVPNYEPAPMFLATPFYIWGRALGAAAQGVMFFGAVVTAASAALLFLCLGELGYGRRTATLGAFVFAFATQAWPYSRTIFREPLTVLAYLLAIYALLRYRPAAALDGGASTASSRPLIWPALAGLAVGLAVTTKQTSVALLPTLLLLAVIYERRRGGPWRSRLAPALAALVPLGACLLLYWAYHNVTLRGVTTFARDVVVYTTDPQLSSSEGARMLRAFLGVTVSPYKGLFWFSPALLLGLAGGLFFLRRHRWEGLAFLLAIAAHLLGYSRYLYWSGGVTWGSRYMLVLVPFLLLLAAPVLAWLAREPVPGAQPSPAAGAGHRPAVIQALGRGAVLVLLALSVGIQVLGVSVDWRIYEVNQFLLPQAQVWGGVGEAIDALYMIPAYSPVFGHLRLLLSGQQPLDFAWMQLRPQGAWVFLPLGLALSLLAAAGAAGGLMHLWRRPERARVLSAGLAGGALACCTALLLIYRTGDARFDPYDVSRFLQPLGAAVEKAEAGGQVSCCRSALTNVPACSGVMIVPDEVLTDYFLNYFPGRLPWYSLSPRPVDTGLLDQLAVRYRDIWLARDRSAAADDEEGRRDTERYLAERAYKLDEQRFGDWARLVHFSAAGDPAGSIQPRQILGDMVLERADFRVAAAGAAPACGGRAAMREMPGPEDLVAQHAGPAPVQARGGDVLQVGLTWQAQAAPADNYTVFVQLLDAGGQVRAQKDRWPGDGLYPTAALSAGQAITDNLALRLDVPPGRYRLIAGLYRADAAGMPRLSGPSGDFATLAEIEVR